MTTCSYQLGISWTSTLMNKLGADLCGKRKCLGRAGRQVSRAHSGVIKFNGRKQIMRDFGFNKGKKLQPTKISQQQNMDGQRKGTKDDAKVTNTEREWEQKMSGLLGTFGVGEKALRRRESALWFFYLCETGTDGTCYPCSCGSCLIWGINWPFWISVELLWRK